MRWYRRTSIDDVQGTLINKESSRYGGDALDTLSINSVVPGDEGLYRCEYTLTTGTSGQDDDVGCVLVQGQSTFITRSAGSMYKYYEHCTNFSSYSPVCMIIWVFSTG